MRHASLIIFFFFFFNDTATTEIYTLSLHDALPIFSRTRRERGAELSLVLVSKLLFTTSSGIAPGRRLAPVPATDRKSTRLNSSHANISYAVFCLKKKKNINYVSIYLVIHVDKVYKQ